MTSGRRDVISGIGILEALSARLRIRGNINRRIAVAMTLYAVCVILLIGSVSYFYAERLIRRNQRLSLESEARQETARLCTSIDALQENLAHLSNNSLLVNAIIDTSGSRTYIDAFMRSYRPAGHEPIRLTLCDFKGTPISSNIAAPASYGDPDLLRRTTSYGLPFAKVLPGRKPGDRTWLVLAYPVIWNMTRRPEGILVAEVPIENMVASRLLTLGINGTGYRMMSGKEPLFSRNFEERRGVLRFGIALPVRPPMRALDLSVEVENHRSTSLWWLICAYAVSGGILLLFSSALARRVSDSATSKLRSLEEIARRVAESGALESRAEVAGPDDVRALASSFNAMIERLRESREDLERRVRERTTELSVANAKLVRLNHEKERAIERLQEALDKISTLRGMVPICSACKKIRDDKGYWNQIEKYLSEHTEADFSHGICPDCAKHLYGDFLNRRR